MADKPSYLGLLNAIANGEARGFELLDCWSRTTTDPELAADLHMVAVRENEHAAAFAKRMCELGFDVRENADARFAKRLAYAGNPNKPDRKKFAKLLGYGKKSAGNARQDTPDALARLLDDPTIDPCTGALLGRFIAEERDSGRRLRAAWQRCLATEQAAQAASVNDDSVEETLEELCARMDELTRRMNTLKRAAQG